MTRIAILTALAVVSMGSIKTQAAESDITPFILEAFGPRLDDLKSGFYCRTFSCETAIEKATVNPVRANVFSLAATGSLQGTIPLLKGSAKRTLDVSGTYTLGSCTVTDVKTLADKVENNSGRGASRVENTLKGLAVPTEIKLKTEDCTKLDTYLRGKQA